MTIAPSSPDEILLSVENLQTHFISREAVRRAVDGVTFSIQRGQTLGVVGESGSGKSVTALSILRLIASPPGKIAGGKILFKGQNLLELPEKDMLAIRGNQISMIFQEPMTSLNPVFTVGSQIAEVFRIHRNMNRREAFAQAVEMLTKVNIPDPERRAREYPHQMSGGMRQRVMIAMALACTPDLLIADEPTTALDVTVQAQILRLIEEMQREFGASIMMITHDLGVIAETSDEVAVMYAGQVVEQAPTGPLFERPLHPYTQGLMESVPDIEVGRIGEPLKPVPGNVPDPAHFPEGCRFHPRCAFAVEACEREPPALETVEASHCVRCLRWREIQADPEAARSQETAGA